MGPRTSHLLGQGSAMEPQHWVPFLLRPILLSSLCLRPSSVNIALVPLLHPNCPSAAPSLSLLGDRCGSGLQLPVSRMYTLVLYILTRFSLSPSLPCDFLRVPFFLTGMNGFLDAFVPFGDRLGGFIYLLRLEGSAELWNTRAENSLQSERSSFHHVGSSHQA